MAKAHSNVSLLTPKQVRKFWSKVIRKGPNECWLWRGHINSAGYGVKRFGDYVKFSARAHRIAYELTRGSIPRGLELDHLCRNRRCCNPAHLEIVTKVENVFRGYSPPSLNRFVTHCPKGHEYTAENTISRKNWRHCRTCYREWQRGAGYKEYQRRNYLMRMKKTICTLAWTGATYTPLPRSLWPAFKMDVRTIIREAS